MNSFPFAEDNTLVRPVVETCTRVTSWLQRMTRMSGALKVFRCSRGVLAGLLNDCLGNTKNILVHLAIGLSEQIACALCRARATSEVGGPVPRRSMNEGYGMLGDMQSVTRIFTSLMPPGSIDQVFWSLNRYEVGRPFSAEYWAAITSIASKCNTILASGRNAVEVKHCICSRMLIHSLPMQLPTRTGIDAIIGENASNPGQISALHE